MFFNMKMFNMFLYITPFFGNFFTVVKRMTFNIRARYKCPCISFCGLENKFTVVTMVYIQHENTLNASVNYAIL